MQQSRMARRHEMAVEYRVTRIATLTAGPSGYRHASRCLRASLHTLHHDGHM